mgnify:CR=1 FL=1
MVIRIPRNVMRIGQARFDERSEPRFVKDRTAPHLGHDALVPRLAADLLQARPVCRVYVYALVVCFLDERFYPGVSGLVLGVDPANFRGITGKQLLDRPQAGDVSRTTHRRLRLPDERTGFASSAGIVEGPARVLKLLKDIVDLQPGEILVCPSTNPSWAPVFTKIKAAVTDIGGLTSHAAIVCREYGVPSVTGTGVSTQVIKTGDILKVDGDSGVVQIVQRAG